MKNMKAKTENTFLLSVEQQLLVKQHTGLAMTIGKKYRNYIPDPAYSMKDLQQEACLGLCMAAHLFDPQRGINFETYAYTWCMKHVKEVLRREVNLSDYDAEYLEDQEDDAQAPEEHLERLEAAMRKLNDQERKIVSYVHGLSGQERNFSKIGQKLHLSSKRVKGIYEEAMIKLEQTL